MFTKYDKFEIELKKTLHLDKRIVSTNISIAPSNPGFLELKKFIKLI